MSAKRSAPTLPSFHSYSGYLPRPAVGQVRAALVAGPTETVVVYTCVPAASPWAVYSWYGFAGPRRTVMCSAPVPSACSGSTTGDALGIRL
jgi:hypothetical protein